MLGPDSELYKELRAKGAQVGKEVQAPTYWGEKTFTSGPVYFWSVGLFLVYHRNVRDPEPDKVVAVRWFGVLDFLALGRNFDGFMILCSIIYRCIINSVRWRWLWLFRVWYFPS